ncbi:unnamed protein product [Oikopleura dioica]|uniref:Uncharacterized protein n=1 Tax=Oikopleura dioica TaxID=34765 RepID=E4YMS4_OIKDI|nr:unnamed protein product [Oikopleura dioica]CBY38667.1 unnamed protein product [Oikopleura dioica]
MASDNDSKALRIKEDDSLLETTSVKIEISEDGRLVAKCARAIVENAHDCKHSRLHEELMRKQMEKTSPKLSGSSSRLSAEQCRTFCSDRSNNSGFATSSAIRLNNQKLSFNEQIRNSKCFYSVILLFLFPPAGVISLYWSIKSIYFSRQNKKHLALDRADLACIINFVGAWNV